VLSQVPQRDLIRDLLRAYGVHGGSRAVERVGPADSGADSSHVGSSKADPSKADPNKADPNNAGPNGVDAAPTASDDAGRGDVDEREDDLVATGERSAVVPPTRPARPNQATGRHARVFRPYQ